MLPSTQLGLCIQRTLREDGPDDSDDDEDEDVDDRDEAEIVGDALLGQKQSEKDLDKDDPSAGPWTLPIGYERYQGQEVDCPGMDGMMLVNEAAGLEQAVTLMQLCQELGGTATKGDINKMLEVKPASHVFCISNMSHDSSDAYSHLNLLT